MACNITNKNGMLAVATPYDAGLVMALKAQVPGTDRRWDKDGRAWLVSPAYGPVVQKIIEQYVGEMVALPAVNTAAAKPALRLLDVRYLGRAKSREDGRETAFAWVDGNWNAIFPATVLRAWFGQEQQPDESATLYGVLVVAADALPAAIKAAYRRLARQWHPDVCREPNAAEQFRAIKHAYDILSDDSKRARYDAGRALEATLRSARVSNADFAAIEFVWRPDWSPPLRCGYVMARGIEKLGRFVVEEILAWEDITRADGMTLVSSWPEGAAMFTEGWVI